MKVIQEMNVKMDQNQYLHLLNNKNKYKKNQFKRQFKERFLKKIFGILVEMKIIIQVLDNNKILNNSNILFKKNLLIAKISLIFKIIINLVILTI